MKIMGIEWEFIKKENHYLIRYSYRGEQGRYLPRIDRPIEEVEHILLGMVYIPLQEKHQFEKLFPVEISGLGKVMTKYYECKPKKAITYVVDRFRMLNNIKTYFMCKNLHEEKFIEWIEKNEFTFVTEKSRQMFFYFLTPINSITFVT